MTEQPGYYGEDAADYGNPPNDNDVQRATSSEAPDAANVGTSFEPATEAEEEDSDETTT